MKRAYIFDIDGTIADCSHRLHLIENDPKDWRAFFAACGDDKPIPHVIQIAHSIAADEEILFVTGRSDECRHQTLQWLRTHIGDWISSSDIYMRRAGDHQQDDTLKIELLAQLRSDGYEPIMAFDDRTRVVKAWRAAGIPCAQVVDGDY